MIKYDRDELADTNIGPVVKLKGGLGNQMFQFAAGLALARRTSTKLTLDLSFLLDRSPRINFTFRDFDLDIFKLPPDCRALEKIDFTSGQPLQLFSERYFNFDPLFDSLPSNSYLDGYWQAPRYFSIVTNEVRDIFTSFLTPLNPRQDALAQIIRNKNSVCLNVRRGDYVYNPSANAFHGVCGDEYYQQAARYIIRRNKDAHFYIFSDDVEWCKKANLVCGAPSTVISTEYFGDRYAEKMQLMMCCRHFIIPNSTYGWWAAYLGQQPGSIVIAPDPWFNDLLYDTSDLLPKDWIQMSKSAPLVSKKSG